MNFSLAALIPGFIYGVFGIYFFRFGKRLSSFTLMLYGIALMAYPYFIQNILLLWGIGAVLCVLAYQTYKKGG